MKQKNFFLAFLFLLCPFLVASAQNEMFKALFMYSFTKSIEWPAEKQKGDFVIGVFGDSPVIAELRKVAEAKNVGQQKIVVKQIDNVSGADQCNILYLPTDKSSSFGSVLSTLEGKPVLLITDKDGLGQQGACINYVMVSGKLNFEVNSARFKTQKLQLSNSLTKLGIAI